VKIQQESGLDFEIDKLTNSIENTQTGEVFDTEIVRLSHNILKAKNMGLIKEPKNVDLSTKSEPWTKQELADFRKLMQDIKAKNAKRKERVLKISKKNKQPV
jgi:hypothetical protein